MQAVIERHVNAGPDLQQKLAASRAGAQNFQLRTIRCPCCGFYLLDVYGREHYGQTVRMNLRPVQLFSLIGRATA